MSSKKLKNKLLNGWRSEELGSICTLQAGKFISANEISKVSSKNLYPCFGGNGIRGYVSRFSNNGTFSLIGRQGALCGNINKASGKFYATEHAIVVTPKSDVWTDWLYYKLIQLRLNKHATGVAQPGLSVQNISGVIMLLPPYEEQKAIAKTLKTWDEVIQKTEALIKAKQKRFEWLVKTLISDQINNPKWHKVALGEIGEISSAGVDKKIIEGEQKVRLVNYLDVYRRDKIYSDELDHHVTAPTSKVKKCSIQKGDIFFTPSSETRNDIGHSAVAMEDISDATYSYHIVRLRPQIELDLLYSAYAFKSSQFYKQMETFADGSGQRYVVSQGNFRKIEISLPNLSEQKSIAQILNSAQNEIKLLQELAQQYRTQKRGLMQKLLTGKIRINNKRESK